MLKRLIAVMVVGALTGPAVGQWVARDERWQTRGGWNWALERELPQLYREFNGIDFGHALLAETLLKTQDAERIEEARLRVLNFIFSDPPVPPDEDLIGPTFTRMVWELRRTFNWAHTLHRSLYDVFADDGTTDKEAAYRRILDDYLSRPEAITPEPLDHHGALWSFPESKTFRDKFPKFNTQIWAYHWLQAAAYDVQLMGPAASQRELMPKVVDHYHTYLRTPPVEWRFMPMFREAAPRFAARFPEAANIFDNLHMLHDNVDDVLCRPDLYPTWREQRARILEIMEIYLHRNHGRNDRYPGFHGPAGHAMEGHGAEHGGHAAMEGPRPPSVQDVIEGNARPPEPAGPPGPQRERHEHGAHP